MGILWQIKKKGARKICPVKGEEKRTIQQTFVLVKSLEDVIRLPLQRTS